MRRHIDLLVDGHKVDLDNDSFILLNYEMDEMQNPTIVKNSWSQSITLPGTENNDTIFGDIYRFDRIAGVGLTHSGLDFNALKRTPFTIVDELGRIIESGYCRIDSIDRKNGIGTYSLSLFGGLGGLFWHLTYKPSGVKKTLADLYYKFGDNIPTLPSDVTANITKTTVNIAWNKLAGADDGTLRWQFNFAPCYNGFPACKFDANKAVYLPGVAPSTKMPNLYTSKVDGGKTYIPKLGASSGILLEMANKHTEWEMQDLRTYLQRPIVSVKWLLKTIAYAENTGDYTLVLDSGFFNSGNPWFENAWMTLPMVDRDNLDPTDITLDDMLQSTGTPADYLIGFAKMFGLVFVTDPSTKTITLMGRNDAYGDDDVVNLDGRVENICKIELVNADTKYLLWQTDMYGEFVKTYAEKYERAYGSKWVDTGTEFDADDSDLLDVVYKGAADVLEASGLYQVYGGDADAYGSYVNYLFKIPFFEDVSWRLYHTDGDGDISELECKADYPYAPGAILRYSMNTTDWNDFMVKAQLHDDGNKATDGSNVLLFFDGIVNLPADVQGGISIEEVGFHLSDDSAMMLSLNNGVPCWETSPASPNVLAISSLPQFRRWRFTSGVLSHTWDFGDPREIAVPDAIVANKGIYPSFWSNFITDRYDVDNKVVTCKVDMTGWQVGEELLRKFYHFGGAVWVMNAIHNYSLTTYGLVECEFVKVYDIENYHNGQNY